VILIEALAHKIADKISFQLNLDEDRNAVIAYGLIGILQVATIFIIITIIGIAFDFLYESLIIYTSVGYIRKSTGGAHSSSMNGCNIISVLSITLLSTMSRYLYNRPINNYMNIAITIFVFIICFIVFYHRVPVDNPKKPIVNPEKIKRLRKQSFIKLALLFFLTIISIELVYFSTRFYSIANSIRLASLWQLVTLTEKGILFMDRLDIKINKLIKSDGF